MKKVTNIFTSVVYVADEFACNPADKTVQLADLLRSRYSNYEVLLIDNGISSKELDMVKKSLSRVPCIRVIRLSKSHDTDTAIFAGIEAAIGDYICVLYNNDPEALMTEFVERNLSTDIVFGVADNLRRQSRVEQLGARLFYWYSNRYLKMSVPKNSTYYLSMNRSVANALTHSGRYMRHIRHMAHRVGFKSTTYRYSLPDEAIPYSRAGSATLISRAIDLVSNYSSHPLRALSYFGLLAGALNIIYAIYVVIVGLSKSDVAQGWTTTSLQSSLMFFILFIIMATLAEYIGKILNEVQQEPPYHIMQELSSTISIADETRLNVTK